MTAELQDFSRSSLIITAYMLTYAGTTTLIYALSKGLTVEVGCLIIWARFSDIFGRKLLIVTSLCFFVIFSGACGAAQRLDQL